MKIRNFHHSDKVGDLKNCIPHIALVNSDLHERIQWVVIVVFDKLGRRGYGKLLIIIIVVVVIEVVP